MQILFIKNFLVHTLLLVIVFLLIIYGLKVFYSRADSSQEVATVVRGTVSEIITVSGKIDTENVAKLGFPVSGTVKNVYKHTGDRVIAGEIIASLTQDILVSNYNIALQNLAYQKVSKEELVNGPTQEERNVTTMNVRIAEEQVARVEQEHARIVQNALETLLSTGLEALSIDSTNDDIPPTITGNYQCPTGGTYTLSMFPSASPTDYSFTLSGIEEGTFTAYTKVPTTFGSCGLSIQFDTDERYRRSEWNISIPNTRDSRYLTNLNAYKLALQQQTNAIAAAVQTRTLAYETERSVNATPSKEALDKAGALVAEAQATLALNEAQIADYTIRAPFDGIITDNDIRIGELADANRNVTLLKEGLHELKARIPEVDINKIHTNDSALVIFDAQPDIPVTSLIDFVSPLSTEIDGVAYYEARFILQNTPGWIRAGLNADVNIIVAQRQNVLTLPKRFVITDADNSFVFVKEGNNIRKTPITRGLTGNDGFIEVMDLAEGTIVTLP